MHYKLTLSLANNTIVVASELTNYETITADRFLRNQIFF